MFERFPPAKEEEAQNQPKKQRRKTQGGGCRCTLAGFGVPVWTVWDPRNQCL